MIIASVVEENDEIISSKEEIAIKKKLDEEMDKILEESLRKNVKLFNI